MGLDNLPHNYPCSARGTAVMVPSLDRYGNQRTDEDGTPHLSISCSETQDAGGCPWMNASPPEEGRVIGIFGTDCWYRGKHGNAALHEAGLVDDYTADSDTFYGDNEDGTYKSPQSCIALADTIRQAPLSDLPGDLRDDLLYAEWYLRWAADQCGGLVCWY